MGAPEDVLRGLTPDRGVAVFGSHSALPDSTEWERAEAVGREIGGRGLAVVTGGYGGVMEAASRGARGAGGEAIGVTCRTFRGRSPNRYLSLEIEEADLLARTARLLALSRGFVVLGGGVGTLAELATLWAHAKSGVLPGPVVLWDATWVEVLDDLETAGRMEFRARNATSIASSAEMAVQLALAGVPAED